MTKEEKQLENQQTLEQFQVWLEQPYTKKVLSLLAEERMLSVKSAESQVRADEPSRKLALDSLVESRTIKYIREILSKPVGLIPIIETPTESSDKFFLRSANQLGLDNNE